MDSVGEGRLFKSIFFSRLMHEKARMHMRSVQQYDMNSSLARFKMRPLIDLLYKLDLNKYYLEY
jgi:hypothetical protein